MSSEPILKICCHFEGMAVPSRGHKTDAGLDLTAMAVKQKNHGVFMYDSGISIQISDGYYVEVVPRSSLSLIHI